MILVASIFRLADQNLNVPTHILTNLVIRHPWRDVGPCRVRLASLTGAALFQLFLTDEEQFANRGWPSIIGIGGTPPNAMLSSGRRQVSFSDSR